MSEDIRAGDVVVCVDASPSPTWGDIGLRHGHHYRVACLSEPSPCYHCNRSAWVPGLMILGLSNEGIGFCARRFRKLRPAEDVFIQASREWRPIEQPVEMPAFPRVDVQIRPLNPTLWNLTPCDVCGCLVADDELACSFDHGWCPLLGDGM